MHKLSISKSPTQTLKSRINQHPVHLQVTDTNTKVKNQSTSCPPPSHQRIQSIHILSLSKSPTQTLRSRINQYPVHLQVTNTNTKDNSTYILSISESPTQTLRSRINPHLVHLQVTNTNTNDKNQPTSCRFQVTNANTKVKNQSTSCLSPYHQSKH